MKNIFLILNILFISFIFGEAKTINDMLNREVEIPDFPKKVYAPSPYGSYALYAINPELLTGWIFSIKEENLPYLDKSMKTLPVIGRVFGTGKTANLEVLLSHNPDLIVMWSHKNEITKKEQERLKVLNTPIVYVKEESMFDYPQIFTFLGETLNQEKRAQELASYTRKVFKKVEDTIKKIPLNKRPKVYYAEGTDGLSTECDDSIHVELLKIAGDVNIHKCHTSSHKGFEKISMEKLMQYDPDIILVQEKIFFDRLDDIPLWQNLRAVKNKKVYFIPKKPFNWFDRPPSFMRILGLQWLMYNLYPKEFIFDSKKEIYDFYKLFLNVSLTQKQIEDILNKGNKK